MIEISEPKTFYEFVNSCPVVLIHFWARWNLYDNQMKNVLKQVENLYKKGVCFGSVDIQLEAMRQIIKDIKIINLPALVYYKNGEFIEIVIGLNQPIKKKINLLLEN